MPSTCTNRPTASPALYRTQGVATDGAQWFFSWQCRTGAHRPSASTACSAIHRSRRLAGLLPGIPPSLLGQGLDHIGDIDVYNGILYASLDTTRKDPALGYSYGHGRVALFNASDLSYTGVSYALDGGPQQPAPRRGQLGGGGRRRRPRLRQGMAERQHHQRLPTSATGASATR